MKTKDEIEEMANTIIEDYEQNASTWNEAVMATLDWVLGNTEESPRQEQ